MTTLKIIYRLINASLHTKENLFPENQYKYGKNSTRVRGKTLKGFETKDRHPCRVPAHGNTNLLSQYLAAVIS